jgi:hypothetical protein
MQDKISVVENKTEETILNWKEEIDTALREVNVQTDDLYTNLTDMMEEKMNATSRKIDVHVNNLYTNLTGIMKQEINTTSSDINIRINNITMTPSDRTTQGQS